MRNRTYTNMKRVCLMLLAAVLTVAGCKKENVDGEGGGNGNGNGGSSVATELEIGICACETKAALGKENGGKVELLWNEGDEVSVRGNAGFSVYRLKSGAGTAVGKFEYLSGAKGQKVVTDVYFPSKNSGVPMSQTYAEGTFDPAAISLAYHNPSATDASGIVLKCQTSVLCFRLSGTDKLNAIKWSSRGGQSYTLTVPSLQLKSSPTAFYLCVPAQSAGKSEVTFHCSKGTMTRELANKSLTAGTIHRFVPIAFSADKSFRIMSYNIGQCSQGGNSSAKLIADVTREIGADVAVMNEVRSFPIDHGSKIAKGLGWEKFYKNAIAGMGNMITYNPSKL